MKGFVNQFEEELLVKELKIARLQKDFEEASSKTASLETELEDARKKVENLRTTNEAAMEEVSILKVENENLKLKATSLEKELGQIQVAMIELFESTLSSGEGGDGSA